MNGWMYRYPALAGALSVVAGFALAALAAPPVLYVLQFWYRYWFP